MKKIRFYAAGVIILAFLAGCDHDDISDQGTPTSAGTAVSAGATGSISLKVTFGGMASVTSAKTAAIEAIDKITAYVYDSDDAEIVRQDMTITDGKYYGRIVTPADENLRVVLVFYDGDMVRYLGENGEVDVREGEETVAEIIEEYQGMSVISPKKAVVGAEYVVCWDERAYAVSYEVQEATDAAFGDAQVIFDGNDVQTAVTHEKDGVYYYRARVNTSYGYGPWYSAGVSATSVVTSEGDIILDGDVPGDEPSYLRLDFEDGNLSDWLINTNSPNAGSSKIVDGDLNGMGQKMLMCKVEAPSNDTDVPMIVCLDYPESQSWSGYRIGFDFMVSETGDDAAFNLMVYTPSYEEKNDYLIPVEGYLVRIRSGYIRAWSLEKAENASLINIQWFGDGGYIQPDVKYHLDFRVVNGTIQIMLDNEVVIDYYDESLIGHPPSGAFSMTVNNSLASEYTVYLDNITIQGN